MLLGLVVASALERDVPEVERRVPRQPGPNGPSIWRPRASARASESSAWSSWPSR